MVGLAIQLFLVARIYRTVGIRGALLIHPAVVAVGYGLLAVSPLLAGFVPIFTIVRLVKIAENATDYSLMNTTRQALFLPVDRDSKYEGKTAIDTFFWRFGDLIQAGVVYVGLNWFGWTAPTFAALNLVLALVWIGLAVAIGREFGRKALENVTNVAPGREPDRGPRLCSGPAARARDRRGRLRGRGPWRRIAPVRAAGRWPPAAAVAQVRRAAAPVHG